MKPPPHRSRPREAGAKRHDRRWFGRLEQEDQRLKKHYGHWMDIIILRIIRRHFLVVAVVPAIILSMYSPRPMEAIP